jgi:hypothetical protein
MFKSYLESYVRLSRHRSGVAMAECAIVLPILFFMVMALVDLGIATVRYNAVASAARCIARTAVIRGSECPVSADMWGPENYEGTAADGSATVASIQNLLPTMANEDVLVSVSWLDNDNSPRDRVEVEVRYIHQPLIPGIFPWGQLDLSSISTVHVVN